MAACLLTLSWIVMAGKVLLASVLRLQLLALPYSDSLLPLVHLFWAGMYFLLILSTPSMRTSPDSLLVLQQASVFASVLSTCLKLLQQESGETWVYSLSWFSARQY